MLKLIGAVLIFGSCAALGLSARQDLRRRVKADDAMLLALNLISSEIVCRQTPIPEIVTELSENDDPIVRMVFAGLRQRLNDPKGLSLSYLWRMNLRELQDQVGLGKQECEILGEAANYLGRYTVAEQKTGLDYVIRKLSASRAAADAELQSKGGLYRTCGMALGLLVVLVLI